MPARKWCENGLARVVTRLTALMVLQALYLTQSGAQQPDSPKLQEEIGKQESIYRSQGGTIPGGYITGRSLSSYTQLLPAGFAGALRRLGPKDRWLDIGAGAGQAILDYYAPEYGRAHDGKRPRFAGRARAVALSIEDRRTDVWQQRAEALEPNQIRYLFGKRLREYSREELGKFQLITDVYGGFSYTDDLSLFMEKVVGSLDLKGSFYTLLQSVHLEDGKDRRTTWYLTELVDGAGGDVTICSWLKNITCTKVTCDSKSAWETPTELIHVRKVCNNVSVPPLKPLSYEAGTPPGRRFQLMTGVRGRR